MSAAPATGQPQNLLRLLERVTGDDQIAWRVLREVFLDASSAQWQRRAEQLEAARPRSEDYHGRATRRDLDDRWQRLTEAAAACRARAELDDVAALDLTDTLHDLATGAAA